MKKKGKKMNNQQESQTSVNENETLNAELNETIQEETNVETEVCETPTQEEWAAALSKTVEERDSYKDALMRQQAEFANFKRRNASVRTEAYDEGVRETLFQVLPIIDNLDRAIAHAQQQGEDGPMVEGVKMTLKLMADSLGKLGLEEVPALGEKFDPELHNAIMRESGGEEDVICEVFQKGYRVKDKIIRYAMVKVSSGEE